MQHNQSLDEWISSGIFFISMHLLSFSASDAIIYHQNVLMQFVSTCEEQPNKYHPGYQLQDL